MLRRSLSNAQAEALQRLPSVDRLLAHPTLEPYRERFRSEYLTRCAREALDVARRAILTASEGETAPVPSLDELAGAVRARLDAPRLTLRRVLNLTGTVTHTNLGRALLPEEAVEALRLAATHYVNLEYDLLSGERGHRDALVEALLCRLTGAEAATVVNNNAAAVLIALRVLAEGKEVIVSRGELIEIGGSFRIPDVMRSAGAILREVGTTNRTHPHDYVDAIGEETALLLKVHPSNYAVQGFTSEVELSGLVAIGREHGIPVMEDLGSGALVDLSAWGLPREPVVADRIRAGADLVTFSGDKLLGGPQAGILVGREEIVRRIRRHPLMRALRVDKLTYAALAATLDLYATSPNLPESLPMLGFMTRDLDALRALSIERAARWRDRFGDVLTVQVEPSTAEIGSGAQPTVTLESCAVTLASSKASPVKLARFLRNAPVPVIGRIAEERVWLDLRTVRPSELDDLDEAIAHLAERLRDAPGTEES